MTSSNSQQADVLEHVQLEGMESEADKFVETWPAFTPPSRDLQHGDELILPLMKSVILQYVGDPESPTELCFYYADKEVIFDDPAQFAFGEALAKQTRFVACEAMGWAGGDWPTVKEMLENLIEAQILSFADDIFAKPMTVSRQDRDSPLPPAVISEPPTWDEDGKMMAFASGRSISPSQLEMVMPVFRIVHMYMDSDGRQIGEANVWPRKMRLDLPTEWKTCTYEGSRYQPDEPMNATALRAMRAHWREMMAVIRLVREAYFKRFPEARNGWTLADMERMTVIVLCMPTFMMMRSKNPVANGDLHPVLSSLFRVTDGLRLTMHQMMFTPTMEPMRPPDMQMTPDQVWDYANRNRSFHSGHGVCAGPPFMIKEFLSVAFDGAEPAVGTIDTFDPAVQEAIDNLDQIFDYAMLGLQSFAVLFSNWPEMAEAYDRLYDVLNAWEGERTEKFEKLRSLLEEQHIFVQNNTFLTAGEWRSQRLLTYEDMYDKCDTVLTGAAPELKFLERTVENDGAIPEEARAALRSIFAQSLDDMADPSELASRMTASVASYLSRTQNRLKMAETVQEKINNLLGRPAADRRMTVYDIGIYILLLAEDNALMPMFADELRNIFGIHFNLTAEDCSVSRADLATGDTQSLEIQELNS